MKNNYDVVVIGSGIGGLSAAALLSKGSKVLVLEKNRSFGGYCTSFRRGGFEFESTIHSLCGCDNGHFVSDFLKRCGVADKIAFLRHRYLYRAVFPRHNIIVPQGNAALYADVLSQHFPDEASGIKDALGAMREIFVEVERINKAKSLLKSPNLVKFANATLKDLLDLYIRNEELKAIMAQYWVYCGIPPAALSSVAFAIISQDYLLNGSFYVEGGMKRIVDTLVDRIRSGGGDVRPMEEVDMIRADGMRSTGVTTKAGNLFGCDYLVSNIDVVKTFKKFGEKDAGLQGYVDQISSFARTISSFKVYLGLDVDVKRLGVFDYEIFLNSSYDADDGYRASVASDASRAPCMISIYSNVDQTACAKGKSVLSITMLAGYDAWEGLSASEYSRRKRDVANALIKRAEKVIPALSSHIETMEAATPLTMQRYTGNGKGASYGWNRNSYMSKYMNVQTPVHNLFLSSNWTKIGGGVAGVMRSAERVSDLIGAGQGR